MTEPTWKQRRRPRATPWLWIGLLVWTVAQRADAQPAEPVLHEYLTPDTKGAFAQQPMVAGAHEMSSDPEEIQDDPMDRQEALRVAW